MVDQTFHVGGFLPDHPARNVAFEFDNVRGRFRAWDVDGELISESAFEPASPSPPDAVDVLRRAIDPAQPNPTAAARTAALEEIVADLIGLRPLSEG